MGIDPELVQKFVTAKLLKTAAAALHDTVAEELAIQMAKTMREMKEAEEAAKAGTQPGAIT